MRIRSLCHTIVILLALAGWSRGQEAKAPLPRVLILGDSISLGYTPVVKKMLDGKALVLRPAENCQHSAYGLSKIDAWLGKEPWQVIHFNWGIWDTHMLDGKGAISRDETNPDYKVRHTAEKYRENLSKILDRLDKTGAKLIFATTTPIMSRKGPRFEVIKDYNIQAVDLMKQRKVRVNDLYELVLPNAQTWQGGDRVHFNALGNEKLGEAVSRQILDALR